MNQPPTVRLQLYFAPDADRAVIVRQGPARQVGMILWHTGSDRCEDGQWIKQKVYQDPCDISPDRRHALCFMLDGNRRGAGRGSFVDDPHYFAVGDDDLTGRAEGLTRVFPGKPSTGRRSGLRLAEGTRAPLDRAATKRLLADPPPEDTRAVRDYVTAPRTDTADLYETDGGRLCRCEAGGPTLIRDFTDMSFEPIRAPYVWREPDDRTGAAKHPPDP